MSDLNSSGQAQTRRPEQKIFGDLIFYQEDGKCPPAMAGKVEIA
jgi:hypothetical protein